MITLVITSCGRIDLLEKTLFSFARYSDHPMHKTIVVEDSADQEVYARCGDLNRKFGGRIEFILND